MKLLERMLWLGYITSVIYRIGFSHQHSYEHLFIILLAAMYFYFSYFILNNISISDIFKKESYSNKKNYFAVVMGVIYSIACVGLNFKMRCYPGSTFILGVSIIFLLISTAYVIFKYKNTSFSIYKKIILRNVLYISYISVILIPFFYEKYQIKYKIYDCPDNIEVIDKK